MSVCSDVCAINDRSEKVDQCVLCSFNAASTRHHFCITQVTCDFEWRFTSVTCGGSGIYCEHSRWNNHVRNVPDGKTNVRSNNFFLNHQFYTLQCFHVLVIDTFLLNRHIYEIISLDCSSFAPYKITLHFTYFCWRVYRNRRWIHFTEFRTAQLVWYWISGNEIMLRQLWSNYTGFQSRLMYSLSCPQWCPSELSVLVWCGSVGRDYVNKRRTAVGCYHELCNSETADQVWRACVLACWPCCLESTSGNCLPGTNTVTLQKTFKNIFI